MTSLVELSLAAEHRRGHGALYDALNAGRVDVARLQVRLAGLTLPRTTDGRIMLAVDVTNWLQVAHQLPVPRGGEADDAMLVA